VPSLKQANLSVADPSSLFFITLQNLAPVVDPSLVIELQQKQNELALEKVGMLCKASLAHHE
jgi:hypothetical protein